MKKNIISFLVTVLFTFDAAAIEACDSNAQKIEVVVDSNKVLRHNIPRTLFGFNLPWYAFQRGLQKKGDVRPELLEWLAPFEGALYRFPGGSPSNSFDWKNSVQPLSERTPMHYEYGFMHIPEFGYKEFFNFVNQVKGKAILTLNLVGPYDKHHAGNGISSAEEIASEVSEFVDWIIANSENKCIGTRNCPIKYIELGNELDWPPVNWSSELYSRRVLEVINKVKDRVPMEAWVANSKTAPWGRDKRYENYKEFNQSISEKLPVNMKYLAYHSYYDGNSIPEIMRYGHEYYKDWIKNRNDGSLLITEHARWPGKPKNLWYKGTGQSGAISTADFILAIIPDHKVDGASWHALGTLGPWQLIRWDEENDVLYPSPVYWGMRTIREALLEDAVQISPNKIKGEYVGGYDLRFVAMKGAKKSSIAGVNRTEKPAVIKLKWLGVNMPGDNLVLRVSNRNDMNRMVYDDNDNLNKERVSMKVHIIKNSNKKDEVSICVPAKSIFSLVTQ